MSTLNARKKMGRPRVDSEEVRSRIQRPLLDHLDAWAEANSVTRAEAIRRLIARGLEVDKG
ncbi:CopG family transcriptional regulator [Komagataeibacter xylinus]|uniref:CopG family transcriptional regulator n=1 Tax=Komagataeibacter xylinus TaxID=28448 RepID=A0A857FKZ7_KOMXY|nr:CopG family transcriptional regulator [Komagataeibacter xylinus]QHC34179.1 CopG family transcriptional regulator [Komagataeibacter xylinus]